MRQRLIEIGGWAGAAMIVFAYGLVNFQIIDTNDLLYNLLNIVGGVGLIIVSIAKKVYQPVLINIFWICIAVLALARNTIFR